ncbi:AAA domain-containing protein [Shimazuella kribbensis]|uniref:AAA domain-containing protein n=1 Tax=Shimazuella kribbensis TaxID=139808 RepID=UPI00048E1FA3|nr:AAA domain-containing protein [Shimazuella kribbensis]
MLDKEFLKSIREDSKEFLICPYLVLKNKGKDSPMIWVAVPVKISYKGIISSADKKPFIPRKYLRPTDKNDITISSLERIDEFWKTNLFAEGLSWNSFTEFVEKFYRTVFDRKVRLNKYHRFLEHVKIIDCQVSADSDHTTRKILECYQDTLKNTKSIKPLAKKMITMESIKQTTLIDHQKYALKHWGQMNPKYGLTPSQRKAIHHYLALEDGECFAIEGPPGTGKTTLLQSVIASLWVDRAYHESSEPPIILASGTTNLAIKNILDMFADLPIKEREKYPLISEFDRIEMLTKRWIDGVNSLGSFCVADSRRKEYEGYQLLMRRNNSNEFESNWIDFQNLELEQINEWQSYFLRTCEAYFQVKIENMEQAKSLLHQRIRKVEQKLSKPLHNLVEKQLLQIERQRLQKEYGIHSFEDGLEVFQSRLNESKHYLQSFQDQRMEWYEYQAKRKIVKKAFNIPILGSWLQSRWVRANQYYMEQHLPDIKFSGYTHDLLEEGLKTEEYTRTSEIEYLESLFHQQQSLVDRFRKMIEERKRNERNWGSLGIPLDIEDAEDHFDCNYRYLAFWLATHYWEARFLIQARDRLMQENSSLLKVSSFYREVAMLTPCFISTMHSAPKFFQNKYGFLRGFADLLIVDEASQALPEMAFPVFSLSKKAIVVGDTKQLPAIPSITAQQDEQNIGFAKISHSKEELEEFSVRAVHSNVMKLANRLTRYIDEDGNPFMLREHFRCHSKIANYFNCTFYDKQLVIKTEDKNDYRLPPLAFAHVEGQEESAGQSRINHYEAASIALWVLQFFKQHKIPTSNQKEVLAILSPFRAQANVIKKYLKRLELSEEITVNTVHSLQGMQKEVVLFSPAYTDVNANEFFYDRDEYLLNVAASRAKQSFLIFGDMHCFGSHRNKGSAKLKSFCVDATERLMLSSREKVENLLARELPFQKEESTIINEFNFFGDVSKSIVGPNQVNSKIVIQESKNRGVLNE